MAYKRSDYLRGINSSGSEIPANSFVRIYEYDGNNQALKLYKPNADNMNLSEVGIVSESIPANKIGLVQFPGICVVKSGGGISAGDCVGTGNADWTAQKVSDGVNGFNDGQFYVIDTYTSGDTYLIICPRVRESFFNASTR